MTTMATTATTLDAESVRDDAADHAGFDLPSAVRRALREQTSSAWRLVACETVEVRQHLNKRIVFGRIVYQDGSGAGTQTADIVAKVYGGDRGAHAMRSLQCLWDAGFRSPAEYRVPRPYGYLPDIGTLVQGRAPGIRWADTLRASRSATEAASIAAAGWLRHVQASSIEVDTSDARDRAGDPAAVRRLGEGVSAEAPEASSQLEPLVERLAAVLVRPAGECPAPTLSHGDYHPMNVFVAPGCATVIDFDALGRREPGFDTGYAIGQLLVNSYLRQGSLEFGARAALSFWRTYEQGGKATWRRAAVHVARSLLLSLHYEFPVLHTGRHDLLRVWPRLMDAFLESHGPQTLEDLIRHR